MINYMSLPFSSKEDKQKKEEDKKHQAKKEQLHKISVEDLSFKDVYSFPFNTSSHSWVYDSNHQFIFQFEVNSESVKKKIIDILNNEVIEYNKQSLRYDEGMIQIKKDGEWYDFILIRGWGNLTGIGGFNLPPEKAVKIQDTLAEYIIEKLG